MYVTLVTTPHRGKFSVVFCVCAGFFFFFFLLFPQKYKYFFRMLETLVDKAKN